MTLAAFVTADPRFKRQSLAVAPKRQAMETTAFAVNAPALQQWPSRVAIVPFGKTKCYGKDPAVLLRGDGTDMDVCCPAELMEWADCQSPRKVFACWDILSCLPCEVFACDGTGFMSDECWSSVYCQPRFKRLLKAMKAHPCDLVMSGAQLLGERSVVQSSCCVLNLGGNLSYY